MILLSLLNLVTGSPAGWGWWGATLPVDLSFTSILWVIEYMNLTHLSENSKRELAQSKKGLYQQKKKERLVFSFTIFFKKNWEHTSYGSWLSKFDH